MHSWVAGVDGIGYFSPGCLFWRLITLLLKFARIMCDRALYSSTSNKHSSSVKFAFLSFDSIISTDLVCFTSKPKKVYRKKQVLRRNQLVITVT